MSDRAGCLAQGRLQSCKKPAEQPPEILSSVSNRQRPLTDMCQGACCLWLNVSAAQQHCSVVTRQPNISRSNTPDSLGWQSPVSTH
jgi:hypothetical protein